MISQGKTRLRRDYPYDHGRAADYEEGAPVLLPRQREARTLILGLLLRAHTELNGGRVLPDNLKRMVCTRLRKRTEVDIEPFYDLLVAHDRGIRRVVRELEGGSG